MTRHLQRSWFRGGAVALSLAVLFGTGCGPDAKDQKIKALTDENEQLKRDLNDRDRQLNDILVREGDAARTIDDLNRELSDLRAAREKAKSTDGWVTMPNFDMISVPGSVLFDSGRADLKSSGRQTLNNIVADIRSRYSDRDLYVFGHTDNQPIRQSKWKDNWELGAQRALTVIRYLRGAGVSEAQLVAASGGEHRPRTANTSDQGRQQNRRVEFYAVKRGGGAMASQEMLPE